MRKKWLMILVLCLILAGIQTSVAEDWFKNLSLGKPSDDLSPHLTTSGVNTVFGLVPVDLIDSRFYPENDNGITRQVEDGSVIYWVDKDRTSKVGSSNIQTILKLPEGTVNVKCTDESGQVYMNQSPWFDYTSGDSRLTLNIRHKQGEHILEGIASICATYQFLDQNGKSLKGSGQLTIYRFCTDDGKVCLDYLNDRAWQSIPADRFTCSTDFGGGTVVITYQNGLAHIQAMQTGNVSEVAAHQLPGALKHYAVAAYPGAASYQLTYLDSSSAFDEASAQSNQQKLDQQLSQMTRMPLNGGSVDLILHESDRIFQHAYTSQYQANLYAVASKTQPGQATLCAIRWYDSAGNALMTEWFAENAEEIVLHPNTYVYEKAEDIPGKLDGPAVISPGGKKLLSAAFRPQTGDNSYVVDLALWDKEVNAIQTFDETAGEQGIEIYLPYPQGHSYGMPFTYRVIHYFYDDLTWYEPVRDVTAEKEGIRFRVNSLSPIELSWKTAEQPTPTPTPASPPPQTGDSVPMEWLTGLCLTSLFAIALMVFKKKKA